MKLKLIQRLLPLVCRRYCLALVAVSVLGLSGCATTPTIATHPDPQANYANYHSFSIVRPNRAPSNPNITPALLREVNDSAAQAFVQRGYTQQNEGNADMLVLVHGGIEDKVNITDWGLGYGRFHRWGWGFPHDNYELTQYKEGTLIIDVFDGKTHDMIWRGTAVAEVDEQPNIDKIRAAINTIVSRFPH